MGSACFADSSDDASLDGESRKKYQPPNPADGKTESKAANAPPIDEKQQDDSHDTLKVLTWNISGINNNPWEYYVHLDDQGYNTLMAQIEVFLTDTAQKIQVRDVLGEIDAEFLSKLQPLLSSVECEWSAVSERLDAYLSGSVSAFLESKEIGSERLISWPDRLLNTIDREDEQHSFVYRPSAINYYPQPFKDTPDWFAQWLRFMADEGMAILASNQDNKYSQKFGDQALFLALNVALLAVFDAVLISMLFRLEAETGVAWQSIKQRLFAVLNEKKMARTLQLVTRDYADHDVLFLQEVRNNLDAAALAQYQVLFPAQKSRNNQTSVICLRRARFKGELDEVAEVTDKVVEAYDGAMGINAGDVMALALPQSKLVLVSFHGDTGGMATLDVLRAVERVRGRDFADYGVLMGLDANTYFDAVADGKKRCSVKAMGAELETLALQSCFGAEGAVRHTTNCPRTYLQPQLNKAVKRADVADAKGVFAFRAPKDFILWNAGRFELVRGSLQLDNTGKDKAYEADVEYVIPSVSFPSDHCVLSCALQMNAKL